MHQQKNAILGTRVDVTNYAQAAHLICEWAQAGLSRYVCVAPVSSVMEAWDSPSFREVLNDADLVTPDGMPVVWSLRLLGNKTATRVYGPDLTSVLLEKAALEGLAVGFYGSTPRTLARLIHVVTARFPTLRIAYACSPSFEPPTPADDAAELASIRAAAPQILFVGLGSPKQEPWLRAHKGRLDAVMIGVGAAFDFLSGTKPQAPRWMMPLGLEWCFRLATEPRRLWRRYLKHNPRFLVFFTLQLLGWKHPKLQAP